MTDVCSVVAQLKLTPKGKLQYGREINEDDLLEGFSKLYISPYTIRNFPKVANEEINTTILEKKSDCYLNYFTPQNERKRGTVTPPNRKEVPSSKEKPKESTIIKNSPCKNDSNYFTPQNERKTGTVTPSNRKEVPSSKEKPKESTIVKNCSCKNDSVSNYIKPCNNTEMHIRSINDEYRHQSKDLQNIRLEEYYTNILKFDSEHATSIEAIERSFLIKQNEEVKQLNEDQNRASDELALYQALKQQRESVALEKLRQAELHRKEIEMKIKKDNDLKKEKVEKKRCLANLEEAGLKVLNIVTQLLVDKDKQNKCDEFRSVVETVNQEYTELTNIVKQGINANFDLDIKIQEAREKISNLNALLKKCEDLSKQLEEKVKGEQKAKEDEERKAKEKMEKMLKEQEERAIQSADVAAATKSTATIPPLENDLNIAVAAPALVPIESMLRPMLQMFIPKPMFREYLRLSKLVTDTEKLHESFSKSSVKEKKAYKFDLYKVINTTINAISDESPRHLMDKITRLTTLLSGKEVANAGKKVSTKLDPHALILSKDLIAKKLVLQGPTQVASNYNAAFAIAAVALGVWCQFPDVGELLVAHFYTLCPYAVPFYIPKSKEISTVDYCKLIGYNVNGEEVESEDKYLKKLSGVIRLYAAIISSDIPPALGNRNHPHGLEHGWAWFTRVLNLQPRPVTATIIFDFLEVAGNAMMKRFGRQFRKLLLTLCEDVMPKILEVTPKESKAGAMRLQIFLDSCIKEGRVKEPEGYLTKQWYNSTYYR